MSRKKKDDFVLQRKVAEMTQECDNLATRYWRGEASSREQGYEMWLKQVKKISHFIDVFKC